MAHKAHGEGTLFQRQDGRWQASLQVNSTRRVVYGKTRQEVSRKLADLLRQAAKAGALPNPGRRTVADLLDHWLQTITPTLKPRTLADYAQTARLYVRPTLGDVRLGKMTPDRIQTLYNDLQAQGHERTAHKAHAVLHRACKLAVLWGWLAQNPTERTVAPRYHPKRKEVWSAWELGAFMQGARGHWLYPAWATLIASGCRLGELLALEWSDVHGDSIHVAKTLQRIGGRWVVGTPKTHSGERTIGLPAEGIEALDMQRRQQADWQAQAGESWGISALVFTQWTGTPLHGATVSHGLAQECRRLGIRPVTPHGLRHLHASLLLAQGLPVPLVAQRLGHATPSVTMQVYAHAVGQGDKAAAGAIGRALAIGERG